MKDPTMHFQLRSCFAFALLAAACGGAPPPVLAPAEGPAKPVAAATPSFTTATGNALLATAWKERGVVPSKTVDDAGFIRRATLDILGTIPTPEETVAFVANKAPRKRDELVVRLLAAPAYADHWMNYWDDVLMGQAALPGAIVDRGAFRAWLRQQFASNMRWDKLAYALVTAEGQKQRLRWRPRWNLPRRKRADHLEVPRR
jgi:Protein of unknown function (DUF1549)